MKLKFFLPFAALMAFSSAFISCSKDDDGGSNAESSVNPLMVENFVLDGMNASITRPNTGVNFPDSVKFLVYFQNNAEPESGVTYDIGVALYTANNRLVSTFPLYEDIVVAYGKTFKMDDKILLSKDLSDGIYLLKPICKGKDEKDWKEMKLANDFALTINIDGTEAQLKEAFKDIIRFKSISYDKTQVAMNEPFKVTVSLFGNKTYKSIPVFLAQKDENDGYKKLTGETWTPDEQGEGTITFSYAPTQVGNQTYYIISPISDEPITQFSIITKGQTFDISVSNIADEVEYILDDNALKGTFTVRNYDDQVFTKDIYVMLVGIDMMTFDFKVDSLFQNPQLYQKIHFSTASLNEEKGSFNFTNLDFGSYYAITYGIKNKEGKFEELNADKMYMLYTTPFDESGDEFFIKMAKAPAATKGISYLNRKKVIWKQ